MAVETTYRVRFGNGVTEEESNSIDYVLKIAGLSQEDEGDEHINILKRPADIANCIYDLLEAGYSEVCGYLYVPQNVFSVDAGDVDVWGSPYAIDFFELEVAIHLARVRNTLILVGPDMSVTFTIIFSDTSQCLLKFTI